MMKTYLKDLKVSKLEVQQQPRNASFHESRIKFGAPTLSNIVHIQNDIPRLKHGAIPFDNLCIHGHIPLCATFS